MKNRTKYIANNTTYTIKYYKHGKWDVYLGEQYINTHRSRQACEKAIWQRERVRYENERELFNDMKMELI